MINISVLQECFSVVEKMSEWALTRPPLDQNKKGLAEKSANPLFLLVVMGGLEPSTYGL